MRVPKLLRYGYKAAKAAFNVKKALETPNIVKGVVRGAASFLPSSVGFHKKKPGSTPYDTHKLVFEFSYVNSANTEKGLKQRKKTLDDLKKQGYYIDSDLSGSEQAVFFNPITKKVIVGYRGTAVDDANTRM